MSAAAAILGLAAFCATAEAPAPRLRQLTLDNRPWKGDFDQMLERRIIRAGAVQPDPLLRRQGP